MEVFVYKSTSGYVTSDMEDLAELNEHLQGMGPFGPFDDNSEVHVEITGTWGEIRELLSQPCFKDIWFKE